MGRARGKRARFLRTESCVLISRTSSQAAPGRAALAAPWSRLLALLLLVATFSCETGCKRAPTTATGPATVSRLEPARFGLAVPADAAHAAMVQLRDEARPVLAPPPRIRLAERLDLPVQTRQVKIELELASGVPADTRDRPLVLAVQELPLRRALPADAMAGVATQTFWHRPAEGWSVEWPRATTAKATRVKLLYTRPHGGPGVLNLRLDALGRVPQRLVASDLEFAEGTVLVLAAGIAGHGEKDARARIRATLGCAGSAAPRTLVDHEIQSRDGWFEAARPVGAARGCTLVLEAGASGGGMADVVWAVPRIRAPAPVPRPTPAIENVVLISLDTLRADHLSGYGYGRATSPVIDRELIAAGSTFLDVTTTFPQTDISHQSLFTGRWAAAQPVRGRLTATDPEPTLGEILQRDGLETAAFTEDALLSGAFGFWYGFDTFVERSFAHDRRGTRTFADGIRFLEEHRGVRFFLFLHTYLTHDPYVPPPGYETLFRDERGPDPAPWVPRQHRAQLDAYDRTIRAADDLVDKLLDALERTGLAATTLVVLLSDHGESFGEHGMGGHGFAAYREQLGIPLILRGPGIPTGRRIETPVSIVDVRPTIAALVGAPVPPGPGRDLVGLMQAPGPATARLRDRPLFFSWLRPGAAGARQGNLKLLRSSGSTVIYDLPADPHEWKPLPSDARAPGLEAKLDEHLAASTVGVPSPPPPGDQPVDARTERSLRALGYID